MSAPERSIDAIYERGRWVDKLFRQDFALFSYLDPTKETKELLLGQKIWNQIILVFAGRAKIANIINDVLARIIHDPA